MNALIDNFHLLAAAPNGVAKLRELILDLAISGKLTNSDRSKWVETTLSEIGEWGSGGTPLKGHPEYYGGSIPWLVIGDLNDGVVTSSEKTITEAGLKNSSAKIVKSGTLLVAMYGSIGKLGIAGIECATNQAIAFCVPDQSVVQLRYLFYFVRAIRSRLLTKGQGLAQQNISQRILKATEINVPPLAEQQRIVAKVDELMRLCDQLEAQQTTQGEAHERLVAVLLDSLTQCADAQAFAENWARLAEHFDLLFDTPKSIAKLKQALLQLAVQGKLVQQDPNDEPASDLLKKINTEKARLIKEGKIKKDKTLPEVAEKVKPYLLPQGWEWIRLANISHQITDGTHHTPHYISSGVPFLSVKDMSSGELDFSNTRFVSEEEHRELIKRCNPERGDVLLTKVGTTGVAVVVDTERPFSIFVSVALIKFSQTHIYSSYLKLVFDSPLLKRQAEEGTEGVGNKNLVLRKINDFLLPLPPLAEQHHIVAKVEELMQVCDALAERLVRSRNLAAQLAETLVQSA